MNIFRLDRNILKDQCRNYLRKMAKKIRKNPYILSFELSAKDILSLHFGNVSTILYTDKQIGENNRNKLSQREDYILHETDKIGKRVHYFFDSRKEKIKIWPIMVDTTQTDILPLYTNRPCRNCHKPYDTHPFGCPIKYNPHISLNATCNAHTNSNIEIRDKIVNFLNRNNLNSDTNDFFETEQLFCSLPCVKSYILNCLSNNNKAQRYQKSLSYLTLMYKKMYNAKITNEMIPKAPPIEVLIDYGGHLTIQEYRNTFGILKYEEMLTVKRPYMFPSIGYIEEIRVKDC